MSEHRHRSRVKLQLRSWLDKDSFRCSWSAFVRTCELLARDGFDYTVEWPDLSQEPAQITVNITGTRPADARIKPAPEPKWYTDPGRLTADTCRKRLAEAEQALRDLMRRHNGVMAAELPQDVAPRRRYRCSWRPDPKQWLERRQVERYAGDAIARVIASCGRGALNDLTGEYLASKIERFSYWPSDVRGALPPPTVDDAIKAVKERYWYGVEVSPYIPDKPDPSVDLDSIRNALADIDYWREMVRLASEPRRPPVKPKPEVPAAPQPVATESYMDTLKRMLAELQAMDQQGTVAA